MKGLELWAGNGTGSLSLDNTFRKAEVLSAAFIAALSVTLLGREEVLVHSQLWIQSSNLSLGASKSWAFCLAAAWAIKEVIFGPCGLASLQGP